MAIMSSSKKIRAAKGKAHAEQNIDDILSFVYGD
jgi:hypothetical protein